MGQRRRHRIPERLRGTHVTPAHRRHLHTHPAADRFVRQLLHRGIRDCPARAASWTRLGLVDRHPDVVAGRDASIRRLRPRRVVARPTLRHPDLRVARAAAEPCDRQTHAARSPQRQRRPRLRPDQPRHRARRQRCGLHRPAVRYAHVPCPERAHGRPARGAYLGRPARYPGRGLPVPDPLLLDGGLVPALGRHLPADTRGDAQPALRVRDVLQRATGGRQRAAGGADGDPQHVPPDLGADAGGRAPASRAGRLHGSGQWAADRAVRDLGHGSDVPVLAHHEDQPPAVFREQHPHRGALWWIATSFSSC